MNRSFDWPIRLGVWVAVVLPWVNPFAPGPSPAVLQTLLSLMGVALLLTLAQVAKSVPEWLRAVAQAWLIAALVSSVIALVQYAGLSERLVPWINVTAAGEAFANLRQRNQFATLTNIGLLALLCLSVGPRSSRAVLLAWMGAAVLLGLGNAASSSRTGAAQLIAVAVLVLIWKGWRVPGRLQIMAAAVVGYVAGALLLPWINGMDPFNSSILGRLQHSTPDCNSRLVLWSNVMHLIGQRPWLGWGWGELDYAHFVTLYPGARFCDILDNAHNLPLQLAVELGLPAAVLICGVGLLALWRGRPWREADAGRQMAWGVLAVIVLHSMLEYPLWYGPFQMAAGLSAVLLWQGRARQPAVAPAAKGLRTLCLGAAAVLVLGVWYAAWDYHRISQIYIPPEERSEAYRDNTLEKIQASRLFRDQVQFAELTTTPLSRDNAAHVQAMALQMLHFSPEARVVEKLVESAILLGRQDMAAFYLARLRAAFPADYARWRQANAAASAPPGPN